MIVWEFVVQNSGTLLSIAAPLFTYGGITLHVRHSTPMAKPVTRLYRSLGNLAEPASQSPSLQVFREPLRKVQQRPCLRLAGKEQRG